MTKKIFDMWKIAPLVVGMAGLILTIFAWHSAQQFTQARNLQYFETLVGDTQDALETRFKLYKQALLGGAGLFDSSEFVSRSEWTSYVDALIIKEHLPGIMGLGFIDYVLAQDLPDYLSEVRRDNVPDFTNYPDTFYPDKFIIKYISPIEDNFKALGLDIGFEANRRAAAERARDKGAPALTKIIELVQDDKKQAGFLLLIPVYEDGELPEDIRQRRDKFTGWVYAPFIGYDFLHDLANISKKQIAFEVYDGAEIVPESLIYGENNSIPLFAMQTQKLIAGRVWTINWHTTPSFRPPANWNTPKFILVFGLSGTALLCIILVQLLRQKETAMRKLDVERKLHETESHYKALFDTTLDAIVTIDENGRIIDWNIHAETVFGWSAHEVMGKSMAEFIVPPAYRAAHAAGMKRFLKEGTAKILNRHLELEALNRQGDLFPIELTIVAIKKGQNHIFTAFIRDISERRHAQEAEYANRMKSEFLANMSHELRTPLNGIIGTADLLAKTRLSESQYEYVSIISRSGESLLLLINDILDLSKIEAGELDLNPEEFVLRHMIKDAIQPLASRATERNIELNVDYDPVVPYGIRADSLRMMQILVNLVGNAIKFAENGFVIVRVRHEKLKDDEAVLRIEVEDNGIGIPRDKLDDIFCQFSQADTSATKKYGGTGLGLAISKNLAEMMGGRIGVESEMGKGSTFWFEIPVEIAQQDPPEKQKINMDAVKNKKVLVIEPSAMARKIVAAYLKDLNISHKAVASIKQGTKELEKPKQGFDICFVEGDIRETELVKFAAFMRSQKALKKLRPILMTTVNAIDEVETIRTQGFSTFILKPVYPDDVLDALLKASGLESFRKKSKKQGAHIKKNAKILLVEDDAINQKVARRMLEDLGYSVDIAENGKQAVEMAENDDYGAVLMDIMMPEMDGYAATRAIREKQEQDIIGRCPIIALTANAMKEQTDKCMEAGMDDFLTKPVRQENLQSKLDEWLKGSKAA